MPLASAKGSMKHFSFDSILLLKLVCDPAIFITSRLEPGSNLSYLGHRRVQICCCAVCSPLAPPLQGSTGLVTGGAELVL